MPTSEINKKEGLKKLVLSNGHWKLNLRKNSKFQETNGFNSVIESKMTMICFIVEHSYDGVKQNMNPKY